MAHAKSSGTVHDAAAEAAAGAVAAGHQVPMSAAMLSQLLGGQVPPAVLQAVQAQMATQSKRDAIKKVDLSKIDMNKLHHINVPDLTVEERAIGAALADGAGLRPIARALRGEEVGTGIIDTVLNTGEKNVKWKHVAVGLVAGALVLVAVDYFGREYGWKWRPGVFFKK
jgi:hypothetical protein